MTDQLPDIFRIDGGTYEVFPLETHPPTDLISSGLLSTQDAVGFLSTGCVRGMRCTWEDRDDRLYLISIEGSFVLTEPEPIFAWWVSHMFEAVPFGPRLERNYRHGILLSSTEFG